MKLKLKQLLKRLRNRRKPEVPPAPASFTGGPEGFISHCLQLLNSTTAGTAIYILSSLCPEESIVLEVGRIDLSQPHRHADRGKRPMSVASAEEISSLQTFAKTLSREEYSQAWLEIVRRWLFTCPMDEEYSLADETGRDLFCQRLRSELIDRILHFD